MAKTVHELLRELGYNPSPEEEMYIKTLAHITGELLVYRNEHKMTAREFAEKTGVPLQTIRKIESGVHNVSIKTLAKIAAALGGELYVTLNIIDEEE